MLKILAYYSTTPKEIDKRNSCDLLKGGITIIRQELIHTIDFSNQFSNFTIGM